MQPDQLTLSVDVANDGNLVTETYTRYEEFQNRSKYIGSGHTPGSRNEFGIYRSFPTKTGNFKGVGKTSVKFTEDKSVPGVDSSTTISAPVILEVSFSVPVGISANDMKHYRQRCIALLDSDAFMDALNLQLMV